MFPEATRVPPKLVVPSGNPGIPRRGFSFGEARHPGALVLGLCVGDRQARADCQCGELIDRIAAGTPVRKLLLVEALGHARVPFLGDRPDHRAGLELAAIDAHRAAEAAADSNVDSMIVLRARRGGTGSKYVTFRGGLRRAIPFRLVRSECDARDPLFYADKRSCLHAYCLAKSGK